MRVVRSSKGRRISKYAPEEGNRYDGIYKVGLLPLSHSRPEEGPLLFGIVSVSVDQLTRARHYDSNSTSFLTMGTVVL